MSDPLPVADWRTWLSGLVGAMGLSGLAAAIRAWGRQERLEERVGALEAGQAEAQETRESMIRLEGRMGDLEGRIVRGHRRTEERFDRLENYLQKGDKR